MRNDNGKSSASSDYCFYQQRSVYLVYLKNGGSTHLDLSGVTANFEVKCFDPRSGGPLQNGSVTTVGGGTSRSLGNAPGNTGMDWLVLVRASEGDPGDGPMRVYTGSHGNRRVPARRLRHVSGHGGTPLMTAIP